MAERDTSADGLRNKAENALLNGLRPLWAFVNRTPWLARFVNRLVVNNAVMKLPSRPLRLSTLHDYTGWNSLTDRTWFGRYLPPASERPLPTREQMAPLYQVRPDGPRLSDRSTLLFPAFAQWFTDGFLMTDDSCRRRTHTNHQIDLSQVYGLTHDITQVLRLHDEAPGRKGRLRTIQTATGEWAPPLFDGTGQRRLGLELVPDPVKLPGEWPLEKKRSIFAFGGERANASLFTASINTLFLREHNRLCEMLERQNPRWDNDRVFETARNINIVQLIRIVVQEYINHISPYWLQLLADPTPAYHADWNRPNWIPVEFNLLYRWHSLVPSQVTWQGEDVPIDACRFDNRRPLNDGLETAFVSASATRAWALGMRNTVDFLEPVEWASILQGRSNQLASYNDYRANAHYPRVTRFEQISSDATIVAMLRDIYDNDVDRIEFFVGLFAEDLPPRSALPPLIGRMVASDAFSHALTNPLLSPAVYNAATFTQAGLDVINQTSSLADLVKRNTKGWGSGRVSMDTPEYSASA